MKIIVTGGRHSKERELVWTFLDNLYHRINEDGPPEELTVVQGGATGVDRHAREWCASRGVAYVNYPYPSELGRSGGPIRNRRMAEEQRPDMVVAFPGGAGTASMVSIARELGIRVIEVQSDGTWCTCEDNKCTARPCKGECGCEYHHNAYGDFLSME